MTDKPLPVADADSQPFWDACKERRLVAQQCLTCGRYRHPPRGVCPAVVAGRSSGAELAGTGVVESFVVPHRPFSPGFADDVPYVVVHIAMDDTDGQVVLVSNLRGLAWSEVAVGLPLEAQFDERGLPYFVRA